MHDKNENVHLIPGPEYRRTVIVLVIHRSVIHVSLRILEDEVTKKPWVLSNLLFSPCTGKKHCIIRHPKMKKDA